MKTKKELKVVEVNLEETRKKLSDFIKAFDTASKLMPNVIDTEIKPFGNSSHIILPKEYAGKKAKVIIKK